MTHSEKEVYDHLNDRIAREEIFPRINDELIAEHRKAPFGPHSDDLYRVLTYLRRQVFGEERFILVLTKPHEEWALAKVSGEKAETPNIRLVPDERYDTQEEAEHAVFLKRIEILKEQYSTGDD